MADGEGPPVGAPSKDSQQSPVEPWRPKPESGELIALRSFSIVLLVIGVVYLLMVIAGIVFGVAFSPHLFISVPGNALFAALFLFFSRRVLHGRCLWWGAALLCFLVFSFAFVSVVFICFSFPWYATVVIGGFGLVFLIPAIFAVRTCLRFRTKREKTPIADGGPISGNDDARILREDFGECTMRASVLSGDPGEFRTLRFYSIMLLVLSLLYFLQAVAGLVVGFVVSPVLFIPVPLSALWGGVFLFFSRRVRQGSCLCWAAGILGYLLVCHIFTVVLFLCYSAPLLVTLLLGGWGIILLFPTCFGIRTCVRWRRKQRGGNAVMQGQRGPAAEGVPGN